MKIIFLCFETKKMNKKCETKQQLTLVILEDTASGPLDAAVLIIGAAEKLDEFCLAT
jgi:hypothetical protein